MRRRFWLDADAADYGFEREMSWFACLGMLYVKDCLFDFAMYGYLEMISMSRAILDLTVKPPCRGWLGQSIGPTPFVKSS